MQDSDYIKSYKESIRQWLKVQEDQECYEYADDNTCVINFRGGGYTRDKNFFLPDSYWKHAIKNMLALNPQFRFIVITDDVATAKKFFPKYAVHHFSIAKDYSVIKNAHYLILSNSSFAWFPAWLSENLKYCIAPKYWARHNTSDGYWSLGYTLTDGWKYQDRNGTLSNYATCKKEWDAYRQKNKKTFIINTTQTPPVRTPTHKLYTQAAMLYKKVKNRVWWEYKKILNTSPLASVKEVRIERNVKKTWMSAEEIAEYRKTIKIYDVFSFFNELDLLEIRLNILDPYVDYFVLSEATETFSGNKKPLYYLENKDRFKKWNHKIIHNIIDNVPKSEEKLRNRLYNPQLSDIEREIIIDSLTSDTVGKDLVHWLKEFYIKDSARKALVHLNDNDICCISDLDEIWNPDLLIDYSKDSIFKPRQTPYMYFLNNRSNEHWQGWTGTIITKFKNIRHHSLNHLRTHKKMKDRYLFLKDGGWHFTFQGGYEGALRKIAESDHPFYKPDQTLPMLEKMIDENKDYQGRKIKLTIDERRLPSYLLQNKEKYKKFFK